MDDSLLMCMLDGATHFDEQLQALLGREIALVAVGGNWDPAYQFHDEIGAARREEFRLNIPLTRPTATLSPSDGER
ncbi:MAG TPA: hypothetical protein VNM37_05295, partial [Candidatus Dormibacteraeota bacterium]|nr:hypothetical protein [Candidatus Dormibacteraeota bacterium]